MLFVVILPFVLMMAAELRLNWETPSAEILEVTESAVVLIPRVATSEFVLTTGV